MSPAIFDQHVINTAKVSNATHTGDVTDASGVLTVSKINGVSMAGLATGILKNTTGTGVPSIAVAADFPPLNQNTLGNASTATLATTATNIAGGSAGFVPYQTGSGTTSLLNAGTAGYVLTANGSAAPSWGPVTLSSGTSGTLLVASGGTGAATFTAGILKGNGTSAFTTVTAPTGDVVGTSDTQTLTNKTMGSGTTFSSAIGVSSGGTGQTTFTAGVLKADGTTGFTTVTAPTGAIVGTSDTQTLTNKTLTSPTLTTPVLGTPSSGTLTSCTGLPLTTGVTGTLLATNGGTGQSSYAVGDLLYASTTTSVAKLADVATGSVLLSGGIDTAPAYGKVGLTTHVTGTLPVSNGGTGLATITGYVKGTGTSPLSTSATIPVADISGILPVANGGTGYGSDGIGTLSFDTTPDTGTALTEGQLRWNATDKTLDLKMTGANVTQQIGEELLMRVHAAEEISNGNIVYISGQNSGLPAVLKASANNINSRKTLAVATEDIASGSDGYVTLYGLVRGLDLSAYTAGQELWLANSGLFTGTEAAHPDYKVRIGFVIVAADGTGVMYSSPKFYENGTVNGTGKIGYLTGSGGTVTQATSKTTGVTLHKTNGQITMHNASLSGYAAVSFTLTNSTIDAGDVLVLNHIGGGTLGTYAMNARSAADSATISLSNLNNGSLSEAVVIAFAVIKAVTA
jgi:hypothetical protein